MLLKEKFDFLRILAAVDEHSPIDRPIESELKKPNNLRLIRLIYKSLSRLSHATQQLQKRSCPCRVQAGNKLNGLKKRPKYAKAGMKWR